ncbi:DUF4114 domain-containing protein [Calothrix sp. CCY 0018]|uniref:DUF4114 domain-containing protein n=1 Tax=Calothrix sp. CCY 0018 TaxID=3103864 RepID=UPI0039C5EF52
MTIYRVKFDAPENGNGDSWDNAFKDLQSALSVAKVNDQIWVAKGTYTPGDNRTDSFQLPDGVTIYGGFAGTEDTLAKRTNIKGNETILSGDIGTQEKTDNSYTVVTLSSGTATLDGFTIQNGFSNQDAVTDINDNNKNDINNNGGGIHNKGNLTVRNVVVKDNQANADGGGILNDGNLTIENSEVIDNKTEDDGGGIRNNGTIIIIDSTIANNESVGTSDTSGGGGLINTGASATIINSTFSGNTARNGGAIRNDANLELINSTLSGNTASESGGGLVNTINPDTFSKATATITNSTITDNTAQNQSQQNIDLAGGGIANFGNATISNSIIAGNTNNDDLANDFELEGTFQGLPIKVPVTGINTSGGSNLIGNGEGVSGFINDPNGDKVGTQAAPIDPLLDTLKDNGGSTQTHALLQGSPAINAGNNSNIADDKSDLDGDGNITENIPFEQRGEKFERIVDGNVDIGAVEYKAVSTDSKQSTVFINEFHYDNAGSDINEFIEIAGTAGTDVTGWSIVLYNGTNGTSYSTIDLSGTISDQSSGFGTVAVDSSGMQNGSPDGIALVDNNGNAVQFLSYKGSFTATDGAASGLTSTDIGVSQLNSAANSSLQLQGTGSQYSDFTWVAVDGSNTKSSINTNQTFTGNSDTLPGGNDTLTGGSDTLTGGNDTVTGGSDTLTGGNDTVTGGSDTLTGGNDTVTGGSDTLPETTPVEPSTDVNKLEIIGTNLQKSNNIEVIDLRNQIGTVKASVEVTRDADYDNLIGFYIINDANGGIKVNDQIINPGDSRYKQAALENRITSLDLLQTDNQAQFNGTFESGSIFAPFIIIDGTFADALNNSAEVYFAYQGANTDNFDHIRLLDDNSFGFEDLPEGGDKDYNDLIIKMDFTV